MPCVISGTILRGSSATAPPPEPGVVVKLYPLTSTLFVGGNEIVGPWPEDTSADDGSYALSAWREDETDPPVDWILSFSTGLQLQGRIPNEDVVLGGAASLKDDWDWVPVQDASTGPVTVMAGPRGLKGDSSSFTNETAAETYASTGSGKFANAIAALAAAGENATLVVSDAHTVSSSMSVPANVTLRFTGKGAVTVADTPSTATLVSAWNTTLSSAVLGTTAAPVAVIPVVSTAGMTAGDTVVFFSVDGNGATSLLTGTILTIDSGIQFTLTTATAVKQTIASGSVLRHGYKALVNQLKVSTVAGLQVGDDFIVPDNGQTIYSSVIGGTYTPDTGEILHISAIDATNKVLTFSTNAQHPHTNETCTGMRKLMIYGAVDAPPTRRCFVADMDGTSGRVKFDANSGPDVWVEWFGAKGDATVAPTALGTDSTKAIQAAIMSVPQHGGIDVRHAGAAYRITDSIKVHQSSKYDLRDSMRIFGRSPQNDQLTQGPTTWIWSGAPTLWKSMLELWTRNTHIEGIWFNVAGSATTPYTLSAAISIDRANASVTCTANSTKDCFFGEPTNWKNQIMHVGILEGQFNANNSDFFEHRNDVFHKMQKDALGTVGTGSAVYVPNTTDQHKRHQYYNCDFRGSLTGGQTYYGWNATETALYYASGSYTCIECHFYSIKRIGYYNGGSNNLIFQSCDSEDCLQFLDSDSTSAGSLTIIASRFSTNAITGNAPAGWELFNLKAQNLTVIGSVFNPGTERSFNDAPKVICGGTFFHQGCQWPNPEIADMGSSHTITELPGRATAGGENNGSPAGTVGALTRNARRRFLQGNYLDGTIANDGGVWFGAPLAAAVGGGAYKLTPPGVVRVMNLPVKATVIATPSGGTSVPAGAFLWYGMTRITASGTERPTGTVMPVQAGAASQVVLNPPAAYEATDTGFNIYRAVGTDLTTVPAATAFHRITTGVSYALPRAATDLLYITDDHADVSANAVMPNVDVAPPTASPTLSSGGSTGVCTAGSHVVAFSSVTTAGAQTGPLATGESFVGPVGAAYTVSAAGEKVHVTGIPTSGGAVAGHSIYMSKAGTRFPLYWAGWVADGTGTFDIAALDAALTVRGPQAIPAGAYYYCSTAKTRSGGSSGIFVNDKVKATFGLPGLPILRMPPYLPGSSAYGIERTRQGEAAPNTAANYYELDTVPSLPATATDIAVTYTDFSPDDWITNLAPPTQVANSNSASTAIPEMLSVLGGDVYFGGNVTVAGTLAMSSVPPHGSSHAPYGTDPTYADHGTSFQNAFEILPNSHLWGMHDSLTIVAGSLYVLYFAPDVTRPISQMIVALSAVFNGQNYLEALLYTVGATDSALTVVLRSGNLSGTALTLQAGVGSTTTTNTGMTATGLYSLPFGSSYTPVRGTRYAVGLVANAATTMGKFAGHLTTIAAANVLFSTATLGGVANLFYPVGAKIFAGGYTSIAPAPASHGAASGGGNGSLIWTALG